MLEISNIIVLDIHGRARLIAYSMYIVQGTHRRSLVLYISHWARYTDFDVLIVWDICRVMVPADVLDR